MQNPRPLEPEGVTAKYVAAMKHAQDFFRFRGRDDGKSPELTVP
jgi:hypothetical protein